MTYDQLTMSLWVQGLCWNILAEKDLDKCDHMLMYMADLIEDAMDFNWQNAKAAHTVLCCELECDSVKWGNTLRIDRIQWAHAQKHSTQGKIGGGHWILRNPGLQISSAR